MQRRKVLSGVIGATFLSIAGCAGSGGSGGSGENDKSSVPEPQEPWQRGLPHCSTGDHPIRIRGFSDGEISVENRGVEARALYSIIAEDEYGSVQIFPDGVLSGGESQNYELSAPLESVDTDNILSVRIQLEVSSEYEGEGGPTCWGDG